MVTTTVRKLSRGWLAGLAAIVAVLALLALPPVRAAADQLLSVFRVQNVVFLPVSAERMQELQNLKFDGKTLFVEQPAPANQPVEPRRFASAGEAAAAAGFTPAEIGSLPGTQLPAPEYTVRDRQTMQFQVNVKSARELLALLNITDITLPDALGAQPIVADVGPLVETRYRGATFSVALHQGPSPSLSLPEGVNLAELGQAFLRVLGMEPEAAATLSRQIDWSTTLVFPFPSDLNNVRTVTINGAQGLLMRHGAGERGRAGGWSLYWQRSERFYVIEGSGRLNDTDLIAVAETLR